MYIILLWLKNSKIFFDYYDTSRKFFKKKSSKTLSTKQGEEGFSVELVVVIAVLAILSAVAIPAFVGVTSSSKSLCR